jgi:hypothetical protein
MNSKPTEPKSEPTCTKSQFLEHHLECIVFFVLLNKEGDGVGMIL